MILHGPSGRARTIADGAAVVEVVCSGTRRRPHDPEVVAVWFEVPGYAPGGIDAHPQSWQLVRDGEKHRQRLRLSCSSGECTQTPRFVAAKVHTVAARLAELGVSQIDLSSLSDAYERAARADDDAIGR